MVTQSQKKEKKRSPMASGEVDPVDEVAVVILSHRTPTLPSSPHLLALSDNRILPNKGSIIGKDKRSKVIILSFPICTSFTNSFASSSTSLSLYLDTRKD